MFHGGATLTLTLKPKYRLDSERQVGVFPPANEIAQLRLRVDKTQRLDAVQTAENGRCGHTTEEKKI